MSVVEDVKQRVDIVDLVSQHVALKRAGRGYVALCPFHAEKTPSFHVDPSRQTWHCFGACGTGGDVFRFVMKKESCEFKDALRILAERTGVALDARRHPQEDARRGRLFEINEAAAAYFHGALESDAASTARDYLSERGLAAESIERFQIGYAPNSWDSIVKHLESRGFPAADVAMAGLTVEGERGPYDRFRHRLMFPIRDDRGRVAGFGGRLLPGDALGAGAGAGSVQPKYVNTPQSPIFDKGAVLYGLHLAKEAIRQEERAVIVEGYMDAIAAHEHGFANVVASMGTALTERQVGLLKRYTRNLVLALDADAAGGLATERGEEVIASAVGTDVVPVPDPRGIVRMQNVVAADIRVVSMPEGRDPDEVIRSDGAGWEDMVAQAKPVLDYLFDAVAAKHDLTSPRERSAVAADLLPMIGDIADNVVQSHYLQRLARLAQVDEATLRSGMRRGGRARRAREPEGVAQDAAPQREASRARKEEVCLAMLFRYPELRAEGAAIDADIFGQGENRALFETWIEWPDEGEPFERSLTPDLLPQYERLASLSLPAYDDRELVRALQSTVWGIEQQRLRTAKRVSAAALADLVSPADAQVAERAYTSWRAGATAATDTAVDEADPAAAFVDDMEVGLKVHQRLLDQRKAERPAR